MTCMSSVYTLGMSRLRPETLMCCTGVKTHNPGCYLRCQPARAAHGRGKGAFKQLAHDAQRLHAEVHN